MSIQLPGWADKKLMIKLLRACDALKQEDDYVRDCREFHPDRRFVLNHVKWLVEQKLIQSAIVRDAQWKVPHEFVMSLTPLTREGREFLAVLEQGSFTRAVDWLLHSTAGKLLMFLGTLASIVGLGLALWLMCR